MLSMIELVFKNSVVYTVLSTITDTAKRFLVHACRESGYIRVTLVNDQYRGLARDFYEGLC